MSYLPLSCVLLEFVITYVEKMFFSFSHIIYMASFHFGCTVVDTCRKMKSNGLSGGIYGVAFLGALVYYLQHATTFMMGLLGVIKALFWPAFLMYRILELLRM